MSLRSALTHRVRHAIEDALADLWSKPEKEGRAVENWQHQRSPDDSNIGTFFVTLTDGTQEEIHYRVKRVES